MYAYVRIPPTKNVHEFRKVVPVKDIKRFNSQNPLNPRQLYKIKHNGDIIVGHVLRTANTKSELEAMVAGKRMNVPPSQHLLSPSDSFSTDIENSPKSAKRKGENLEHIKQHRLKQLKERQALCAINAQSVEEYQEHSTCRNSSSPTSNIEIEDLKHTINAYKAQCDFLKDSLQRKEKIIAEKEEWIVKQKDMEVTIAALQKEVQTLRRLNIELQEAAILKGKEIQNFNEGNNLNVVTGNNLTVLNKHPAVGYITPDNKSIHLGYGEYLPKTAYVAAACDCRRPAIFVRQIAICLFSLETLLNSTVTGKGSNRNRNSKKPENALDCNKILAIKAIYYHYLTVEKQIPPAEADKLVEKTRNILAKFISSLKDSHTCTTEKETHAMDEVLNSEEELDIEQNIEQNVESNIQRDTDESNIDSLRMEEAAQVPNEETSTSNENDNDPDFAVLIPAESSDSDSD
ncbi:uncharacterized protein LOC118648604 isoform X1 [Monomorium pharaonis]|uniref:uncharacterized protein LOC118644770 isoform X1 n=1 Tax=Monomorium pharaonis TaxID=307658 RepID=UPI0017461312|nr:uncharacterized protein LOC118644770 isoform X1 [Monomorium pharaonis]XP_036141388.1 uncharacterized protein LOC118645099 isoform X1 [Monomorium pharaonis]XP_036147630.1 uncharacterized protein LOC118647247 isoform X1 [Monomorium pharaonis]XP_036150819.1 uncharacterized protein LOC118648604 isoform X1 [Monomorium pharaonis]